MLARTLDEAAQGATEAALETPTQPRPHLIVGRAVVEDAWVHLADDAPVPDAGSVTVTHTRWRTDAALRARGGVGVRYPSGEDPLVDQPLVLGLPLIALHFPAFADGRAYSSARKLRRLGFTGQLRATGDILRDQLLYLWRCGFDAFELRADKSPAEALAAFADFTVAYQPHTPGRLG